MDSKVDKLQKKAIRDQQKRIEPRECQKYVRLILDNELLSSSSAGLGHKLLLELQRLELKYELRPLSVKACIIWERQTGQRTLDPTDAAADSDSAATSLTPQWQKENYVLQLITEQELQQLSRNAQVNTIAEQLRTGFPDAKPTMAVLCNKQSNSHSHTLNTALIDLQLLHQVATVQVPPKCDEVAALLRRYTKAISEAPYKRQRSETLHTFKKYLANDKKQCVRVVGNNGFGRLWQQHLNRLPLVTLEVAESIIAQYPCPKRLIDAWAEDADAEMRTLADLKISRARPQPLQTDRRIGNVLSAKLHLLYTTRDPNAII